jgi:hypothetical protein
VILTLGARRRQEQRLSWGGTRKRGRQLGESLAEAVDPARIALWLKHDRKLVGLRSPVMYLGL